MTRVSHTSLPPKESPVSNEPHEFHKYFEHIGYKDGGACAVNLAEARLLKSIVDNVNPDVIVEVGRWRGHSTIALLEGVRRRSTRLISIDKAPVNDGILEKAVEDHPMAGCVELVVGMYDSRILEEAGVPYIDLAFIDGDHSYNACHSDLVTTWRRLKPGGVMIVHDALNRNNQVGAACRDFSEHYPVGMVFLPTDPKDSGSPSEGDGVALVMKDR